MTTTDDVTALITGALQARREKRTDDARRDMARAVEMCRREGDEVGPGLLARALAGLGQAERDLGRTEDALRHYSEAAAVCRAAGDRRGLAHTVRHVADLEVELGRIARAEPAYEEALSIYRADPATAPLDLANAVRGLAVLKERSGDFTGARRLWEEARDLYEAVGVQAGVEESAGRLAGLPAGR